ncbi:hypothetical protein RGUI_2331 [Rhodovulum sp. P5]|uniref:hypothetical protein n=1 Tax=Rhodovulum sp. P5 TaxID=1564506 RepID=UPI0009C22FE4|nr:hypothetical protein [Rhodovulum sp. P5]ARE40472.1 hypothetical protein RGUI_2331 [Rhodovulum sp. P5]
MRLSFIAACAFALSSSVASATVLDFGQGPSELPRFQYYDEDGFVFGSYTPSETFITAVDQSSNTNFNGFARDGGRVLSLQSDGELLLYVEGGTFDFSSVRIAVSSGFFGGVTFEGWLAGGGQITRTLTEPVVNDPGAQVVTFSGFDNLTGLLITVPESTFAIMDDFVVEEVSRVPVPLSAALLLTGLGSLIVRRKVQG